MLISILGSGGGTPTSNRETACVLVRSDALGVLLDSGSGARRLLTDTALLEGVRELHVLLTHFHFDHVCGLPYLHELAVRTVVWAPGHWLYGIDSAVILEPLRRPPIAPNDVRLSYPVNELRSGVQLVGGLEVRTSAQLRHWAPSTGLRIGDHVALITDTPYEATSARLAEGVTHLLHEAWSSSRAPISPDRDATAGDAARVAREAGVRDLTLVHLNPALGDPSPLLDDAGAIFDSVTLGEDEMVLR